MTDLDLDVTSDESVASVVGQVVDRFGRIDVLVTNAGVGATGAAEEFSVTQTQGIFDINVYGVMRMTKAVLPHMRKYWGQSCPSLPRESVPGCPRSPP